MSVTFGPRRVVILADTGDTAIMHTPPGACRRPVTSMDSPNPYPAVAGIRRSWVNTSELVSTAEPETSEAVLVSRTCGRRLTRRSINGCGMRSPRPSTR
ncbi:hypothetical protein [Saccharothrix yanglingensis]|uniref:hypothetical protein n=1 Tax=Saccharothrix yanglingensis TaxID=659496 RepID=UPI0027D2765F|nr:hypothetical protein [Saccharothrix yanglingensis]